MQALSTWIASDGMEACRRACGGHGYSQLSGLPSILQSYVQNVTWEGDNNVMLLQARTTAVCELKHLHDTHLGLHVVVRLAAHMP